MQKKCLTFDVYGTLIDWETGIWNALQPLIEQLPAALNREDALNDFAIEETAQEAQTPGLLYADLLTVVHQRLAKKWGLWVNGAESRTFGASVPLWPAFEDSVDSLRRLRERFKLVPLTNVDQVSFEGSNRRLGAPFWRVFTAGMIGSYKPDVRNFQFMLDALAHDGFEKQNVLHVAQSIHHDMVPATAVGLEKAWINRQQGRLGATTKNEGPRTIEHEFADMDSFTNWALSTL